MNLSAPFIQRPVMTTLLMVSLLFFGLLAYYRLPISSMPNVNYPVITVKVVFPGTAPETMANSIAVPLEKEFMTIPGVKLVTSTNILGTTTIVLQFTIDKNIDTAAVDVEAAISRATTNLPPTLPHPPVYRKVNPAELPIIYISVTSKTMRRADLYTYANTFIGQRISMLDGVSQVTTYGSPLAVRIQVDPAELAAHDLALAELSQAISQGNPYLSTGQLDGAIDAPIILVDGQLTAAAAYEPLVVAYRNGTPIRLQDLGRAVDSFQNEKIFSQYVDEEGSQPTVTIAIQKEPDANTVSVADAITQLIKGLEGELPPALELHVVFDRSIPIREAIRDVNWTLLIALVLVILVIFLYLGKLADTVIPSIVLPMSIIGTFIVMDALHFTLDNLSLLALTLAAGFIVDDAIVVLENIVRRVEAGEAPWQAAVEGSKQIGFTIVSMTLSLVAVFIPMLFMGGLIGKIFSEFAITLTVVTAISGIISLTLTPMLCSRFIPARTNGNGNGNGNGKGTVISRWSERMNKRLVDRYRRMLMAVVDHRMAALAVGFLCLVVTVYLFHALPSDFTPDEDIGFFIAYTQGAEGTSSHRMRDYEDKLIALLRGNAAIDTFVAISSYTEYRKGINFIKLKPLGERVSIQEVIQGLYGALAHIPGLQVFIKNIPLIDLSTGIEGRGAYQYALQSLHADKLYPSAKKLIDRMEKDPIFQGVNSDLQIDSPQVNVSILRDEAARLGVTAYDIENAFLLGYSGNRVSRIQTPVDQYDVILELLPALQRQTDTLNQIWLRSATTKKLVPLSAAARWSEGIGATSISHIDQFPSVTISFNLAPGIPLETALTKLSALTNELVDPSVNAQAIGAAQAFQESIHSAGILLFFAVFAIYIILGILYESFIHPLTILSTLPPAMVGGLITLYIFGLPISMYSFLGIILLIGIVKKNGIMMVDFALENVRQRGMSAKEAIVDACVVRFRPIMMTTVAAIFGALPIALGFGANAAARRPLGLVIIGGLFLSQLLTLFLTPILYLAMDRLSRRDV